ncbi:A-macroglobulin receptor [Bryocella elongata]|uniref:A-macroglobulin receptor n=1 Tax=Bryocella elongata TaxID=863522 RepID=A0A1H5XUE0_9BACT|nr:MG2 domain-containing protein [Bryocella elongata]SEG15155.1 A-macroglobulin receptor [Bryocella elongata]
MGLRLRRPFRELPACLSAVALGLGALACVAAQMDGGPLAVDERGMSLSAVPNGLALRLPVHGGLGGHAATIKAELLDTLGIVRSQASSTCELHGQATVCELAMPPAMPPNHLDSIDGGDLSLYRVRYSIAESEVREAGRASGIVSVGGIAPGLFELHAAAPKVVRAGATYIVRLRAIHPLTHLPRPGVALEVSLSASYVEDDRKDEGIGKSQALTDADGFASVPVTVPAGPDIASVDVDVEGSFGNFRLSTTQTLNVATAPHFSLTTDKPLYQPGQAVHTRMLLLDRNAHADAGKTVQVDVRDPDETLVYRATAVTSAYGIATVDWAVPPRLRLGEYTLMARETGDPGGSSSSNPMEARATVRVSRYDLPTFVVTPQPDRTFYLPGNNAEVEVRANYLFGKPVSRGHVRVVREDDRTWNFVEQKFDVKAGREITGDLGRDGVFRAHIPLGRDQKLAAREPGQVPGNDVRDVHFAAYVTDASTGRTEQRRFDLRLASQALNVYVGTPPQTAGLPQQQYVSVTTADGTPVECDVTAALLPATSDKEPWPKQAARALPLAHLHTDAHGLARLTMPTYEELLKLRPASLDGPDFSADEALRLVVSARNGQGMTGSVEQSLRTPGAVVRVMTPQTIYRPGQPIAITLESAQPSLALTVQVIRQTQRGALLLEARDVTLSHGHATLTLPSDARYGGIVLINAVAVGTEVAVPDENYGGEDARSSQVSRALLFPRDNQLHVGVAMSAETYKPGSEAMAALTVRGPQDADGDDNQSAPTVVGLVAVDRAVEERNRADNDFGGNEREATSFFFGQDADYSGAAGGFTLSSLQQLDSAKPVPEGAQLAAEILLSNERIVFDAASDVPPEDLAGVFRILIDGQLSPARLALNHAISSHAELNGTEPEVAAVLSAEGIDLHALRDPWGRPYTLIARPENSGQTNLVLISDGPDKKHSTADDFEVNLASWRWFEARLRQLQHAVFAYHQRTGEYVRTQHDLAEAMQAEGVAFESWLDPWGRPIQYRFAVEQTRFAVEVRTLGDPATKPLYAWERPPFVLGTAYTDYTADLKVALDRALNTYAASHAFPRDNASLQAALRGSQVKPADLRDPWKHPLYATFRSHIFYADKARTEMHAAAPGAEPEVRTTMTPVTAVSDIVELHSAGADGQRGTNDDFIAATASMVRSTQSAQQGAPQRMQHATVHVGPSGEVSGLITDPSGAAIPGATITATELKTRAEMEAQSDREGQYLLGPLPVGLYKVRFHMNGFDDLVYDQVAVKMKEIVTIDAKLLVGTESQMIEVTAAQATLETSSASVGVTVQALASLPATRDVKSLMRLIPGATAESAPPTATPRLREYFPETLLWRPEILTAADGTATVKFPVADNITSWQIAAAASALEGNTGSGTAEFTTFQPFFAAFDPPSVLTTGDRIALPVTLRNYLDHDVSVEGTIAPAAWFHLDGAASSTVHVASRGSISPVFRFTAVAPVSNALQEFTATMIGGADAGDRIARPVTVHPDGLDSAVSTAAIVNGATTLNVTLPPDTISGSTDAVLKVYPNLGAHLRDAMAAMVAYPDGCAEQIMSIAWPSLLLQKYSAKLPHSDTRTSVDERLQRQTKTYLEQAYQNLLGNQLPSGGFAYWTKGSPTDIALTAYAVEFLQQASEFIAVDPKVIGNAVTWLASQQEKSGLWLTLDAYRQKQPLDKRGNAMLTTSVAAMISGAPGGEPLIRKALTATQGFVNEFDEPYTLANYALGSLALGDTARSEPAIQRLREMALSENGGAYWSLETNTPFYGWGRAGRVESSAQVLRALVASGATANDDLVARGLLFLDHQQDRQSLWYSTQATARVLDVLAEIALQAPVTPAAGATDGTLAVTVDDQPAKSIPFPASNSDSGPIFIPLGTQLGAGTHRIALAMPSGGGSATAQVVANFYRPWSAIAGQSGIANHERLRLVVDYSSRHPQVGRAVVVKTHIERIGFRGYGMLLAEIGLPPGADVDRASLESAMTASGAQLNHYEVLPDRVMLYVSPRAGGVNLKFAFRLRFGIDALTGPSSVYDYYNPDARADVAPTRMQGW